MRGSLIYSSLSSRPFHCFCFAQPDPNSITFYCKKFFTFSHTGTARRVVVYGLFFFPHPKLFFPLSPIKKSVLEFIMTFCIFSALGARNLGRAGVRVSQTTTAIQGGRVVGKWRGNFGLGTATAALHLLLLFFSLSRLLFLSKTLREWKIFNFTTGVYGLLCLFCCRCLFRWCSAAAASAAARQ
ncbi:hypothetical protein JOL62DRAFT_89253 [Phyllosticta paracitricarpa]|uniref:Transmembrane protein n=1 Tax=Phyllosticta paracitricarpa TaxID=2016321 RepID=A0ABR1NAI9_9PEZI